MVWDLNLSNRFVATDWQELSSTVLSFEASSGSFCLKSTYCCRPKWQFKGSHVDNCTIHRKDTVTDINPHFKWQKKLLWIQTCPVVRKNSPENLAYILVQNASSKLPTITIAVKLVLGATGLDHMVLYWKIKQLYLNILWSTKSHRVLPSNWIKEIHLVWI